MLLSRKQIFLRITFFILSALLIVTAVAFILYYANISALNAPQSYRGVFI